MWRQEVKTGVVLLGFTSIANINFQQLLICFLTLGTSNQSIRKPLVFYLFYHCTTVAIKKRELTYLWPVAKAKQLGESVLDYLILKQICCE